MKISYSFTCGRLETIFKLSNFRKNDASNDGVQEQNIIENFREQVISSHKDFESTDLYKSISCSEDKIIQNRLARALRENTGRSGDERIGNEYRSGVWHELEEYKTSERFVKAKELLNSKHMNKTGMEITSRDIEALTGYKSNNIRAILSHKKAVVTQMLEAIEKIAEQY